MASYLDILYTLLQIASFFVICAAGAAYMVFTIATWGEGRPVWTVLNAILFIPILAGFIWLFLYLSELWT